MHHYLRSLCFLFFSVVLCASVQAESQFGVVAAVIGEHYTDPRPAENQNFFAPNPIDKITVSLMPQFIWRHERSLVLLNLELFGALGSLNGSFGSEGRLEGQVKTDTFYRGFFFDSPLFIRFGKYNGDIPFDFGLRTECGQAAFGYDDEEQYSFSYTLAFLDWFKYTDPDTGEIRYDNERYHDEDRLAHYLSFDSITDTSVWKARLILAHGGEAIHLFPSLNVRWEPDGDARFSWDGFIGLGIAPHLTADGERAWSIGIRQELGFQPVTEYWKSSVLLGFLSSNYDDVSFDNYTFSTHYGNHFNYLYQQVGNHYGHLSLSLKEELFFDNLYIWGSGGAHLTLPESGSVETIGWLFSGGAKWHNILGQDSHIELFLSWFIPGSLTITDGGQTHHHGLQIVIKFQQVLF